MSEQMYSDTRWMQQAIATARAAQRIAPPNPAVGCVLVKDGVELTRGYTQRPGSHHAEIEAIEAAKARGLDIAGATAYVTLEPCSHYGRTPPCALRLVKEKIGRVVVGTLDPNPLVAGKGCAILREAGIDVTVGVCESEAIESNIGFLTRMRRGTPWVRMKLASSLDGYTALPNGQSQWITSVEARTDGHVLRADSQGILTGIGTVLADDPQLNVRLPEVTQQPPKFVLDTQARTPPEAKILQGAPCTIYVGPDASIDRRQALQAAGADVVVTPLAEDGRLDLAFVLRDIGSRQVNVLHVEAGHVVNGALIRAGLVDEIVQYVAPAWMGQGKSTLRLPVFETMNDVVRWHFHRVDTIGPDLRLVLRPTAPNGSSTD